MEKFTAMLSRIGLKTGSSDDDGKRSAQSTPRLGRHRVNLDRGRDSQRSFHGSLGSMEQCRVKPRERDRSWDSENVHTQHMLDRSWDLDRVPGGLDRTWETERRRGMELLYQSVERQKEKERHRHRSKDKDRERSHKSKKKRERSREKNYDFNILPPTNSHDPINSKMTQERLERRLEELNRQLLEEKQHNRRDKLSLARVQQEMARQKTQMPWRETLMKELERERMLRIDAEQCLKEMTIEGDRYKARLEAVQQDFQKMEDMSHGLTHYKEKLDSVKQEKKSMTISYENNLQKYRTHISNLEHENKILLAEVKKIESQCANCQQCNKDLSYRVCLATGSGQSEEGDRSKVLLKRLKMLEEEKTALVLENETQRQQYEKCLDEIANQVVQALMGQKTLREECAKLQRRVLDLEQQNRQLNSMFQQRIKFASDSVLQSMASKKLPSQNALGTRACNASNHSSSASLPTQAQAMYSNGASAPALRDPHAVSPFSEVSMESLQSICSDYNEQGQFEECLGQPELSSPPPWLKDKVLHSPTSSIASPSTMDSVRVSPSQEQATYKPRTDTPTSSSGSGEKSHSSGTGQVRPKDKEGGKISNRHKSNSGAKIETEFPADNASPKVRHSGVIYHHKNHFVSPPRIEVVNASKPGEVRLNNGSTAPCITSSAVASGCTQSFSNALSRITDTLQKMNNTNHHLLEEVSPGKELLKLSDSFQERFTIQDCDGLPRIQNNLFDDTDSDTDSFTSRPMSKDFSMASTVSLNELLEQGLDSIQTPNDDSFSIDNLHVVDSDEDEKDVTSSLPSIISVENLAENLAQEDSNDALAEMDNSPCVAIERKCTSSQTSPELEDQECECQPGSGADEEAPPPLPPRLDNTSLDTTKFKQDILNNSKAVTNNCSPRPLLQRPNSLDLKVSNQDYKSHGENPNKKCVEYSSDSDDCTPTPTNNAHGRLVRSNPNIALSKVSNTKVTNDKNSIKGKSKSSAQDKNKGSDESASKNDEKPKSKGSVFSRFIKPKQKPALKTKPPKPQKPEQTPSKGKSNGEGSKNSKKKDPDKDIAEKKVKDSRKKGSKIARSTSSSSPDSAMQQSFSSASTSSGSDGVTSEKPQSVSRDDGYSSNSTASVVPNDFHQESFESVPSFTSPQEGHEGAQKYRTSDSRLEDLPEDSVAPGHHGSHDSNVSVNNQSAGRNGKVRPPPIAVSDTSSDSHTYENGAVYCVNVQYKSPGSASDLDAGDYVDLHWLAAKVASLESSQLDQCISESNQSDRSIGNTPRNPYVNLNYPVNQHASFYDDLNLVRSLSIQGPFLSLQSSHSESCMFKIQPLQTYDLETLSHEYCTKHKPRLPLFTGKKLIRTVSEGNLRVYALGKDRFVIMQELGQLSHEVRSIEPVKPKARNGHVNNKTLSPQQTGIKVIKSPKRSPTKVTSPLPKVISPPPQQMFVGYALMGHRGFEPKLQPKSPPTGKAESFVKTTAQRQSAEGSENGYQSSENLRPEAVGSEEKPAHSESHLYAQRADAEKADVQRADAHREETHRADAHRADPPDMQWMLWSSDSEEDDHSPTVYSHGDYCPNREAPSTHLPEWKPPPHPKKTCVPSPLATAKVTSHSRTEKWLAGVEAARQLEVCPRASKGKHVTPSEPKQPKNNTTKLYLKKPQGNLLSVSPSEQKKDMCWEGQKNDCQAPLKVEPVAHKPPRSPKIFDSTLSPEQSDMSPIDLLSPSVLNDAEMDQWLNIEGLKVKEASSLMDKDIDLDMDSQENDKEFEEITKQIIDFTQTVNNMQRSITNLNSVGVEDGGQTVKREDRNSSSTADAEIGSSGSLENEVLNEEEDVISHKLSESKEQLLQDVDVTDPQARAELLDKLVSDGLSDSDCDSDSDIGDCVDGDIIGETFVKLFKVKKSAKVAVRHSVQPRPAVDYQSFYRRYSEPEKQALDSFAFLEEIPSPPPVFHPPSTLAPPKPKRSGIKTVLAKSDSQTAKNLSPTVKGCSNGDLHNECSAESVSELLDDTECNEENPGSSSAEEEDTVPQLQNLPPRQHKIIVALKQQSRRETRELKRMSNSSLDSQGSLTIDGLSISDSCFEMYSSDDVS